MASLNLLTPDGRPKERVLVTGATGFLGSHCVDQLLRDEQHHYIVRGSVRDLQDAAKIDPIKALACGRNDRLELIEADLFLKDSWDPAVSGCDYVIHIASPVPAHEPKHASDVIRPALDGTMAILEACRKSGHVKKVIITGSALSVYDALSANGTFDVAAVANGHDNVVEAGLESCVVHAEDEWTDLDDGETHNVFVQSKLRAERAAWNFVDNLDALNTADIASMSSKDIVPVTTNSSIFSAVAAAADASPSNFTAAVDRVRLHKQSRHKSSMTKSGSMRHLCCSFPLTTILPVLQVGPCLHGSTALAAQLIYTMLVGGAEMPIVPDIAIEICDVRDVARAHVRALKNPSSDTHRILIFTQSIWLRDVAQTLSLEFLQYGYRVPTRPAPKWFTKLYTFIRRDLNWLKRKKPHRLTKYSNEKMQEILKITPIPVEQTLIDMAHSLIQRGDIRMTPLYKKRMQKWMEKSPSNSSITCNLKSAMKKLSRKTDEDDADASCECGKSLSTTGSSSSLCLMMPSRENSAGEFVAEKNSAEGIDDENYATLRLAADRLAQASEEFEVLPDAARVIESPKKLPKAATAAAVMVTSRNHAEKILHSAAAKDEDEVEQRKGKMQSHANIDSDSEDDAYEDAAENVMVAAEADEKY